MQWNARNSDDVAEKGVANIVDLIVLDKFEQAVNCIHPRLNCLRQLAIKIVLAVVLFVLPFHYALILVF